MKKQLDKTELYHCTNYDSLCKILLSQQFNPSFCLEEMSVYPSNSQRMAFAVVCFADLLEEEIPHHMKSFNSDSYVVMKKELAKTHSVSPVVYYVNPSLASNLIKNIIDYSIITRNNDDVDTLKFFNSVNLLIGYLKQYRGRYLLKDKTTWSEETQFYLEREWRYFPMPQNFEANYLDEERYYDDALRKAKQQELIDHGYALKFGWDDIERIGVPYSKKKQFESTTLITLKEKYNEDVLDKVVFINDGRIEFMRKMWLVLVRSIRSLFPKQR